MFTVLWHHWDGVEELFAAVNTHYGADDDRRPRFSMQYFGVVEDHRGLAGNFIRAVVDQMYIDSGAVYVMNDAGRTVASYRMGEPRAIAA